VDIIRRKWTDAEDAAIRAELMAGRSPEGIAEDLGRTPAAIRARAYVLRIALGRARMWSRRGTANVDA
jgi:hypothetical protein